MTLYDYTVIYNPISDWITAYDYFVGNKVVDASVFYKCKLAHFSNDPTNKPPNATFWDVIVQVNPNTDITSFVETIKETEIGSGEVRSLSLRMNANRGAFITNTNSGATPIIDQFDKISVQTVDRNGLTNFSVYEASVIHPTLDGAIGVVLPVDLLGSEFYLQKTLFADQFFFKSMFFTSQGIVDFYNLNKGEDQVQIIGHDADSSNDGFNDLPVFTANDYTFNINELSHYDGLLEVIDRGGSSVAAGGAGDFFELAFTNGTTTNIDQINFRGFSSGNPTDQISIPNIVNTLSVNPAEQEGEIDATVGNVVGTWCAESIGTLPRQNADFIGALEAWRLFPEHISGATYPEDAIILVINTVDAQGDEFHYKANKDTNIAPPIPPIVSNADWDQHTFVDFLATEVSIAGQYSFWTNNRDDEWKSNGANTTGTLQDDPPVDGSMKVWDSNQVKIDGEFRQTWVDVRALNEGEISDAFKRDGQVYRGFRVLVDGTGTAEFAGFDNDVIQWNGEQWLIFLIPEDNNLVGVDDESRTYQFDSTGSTWSDVTTSIDQANDVYHAVFNITNTQGQNNKDNGAGGNFGEFSAVTFEFRNSITDNVALSSPSFYRQFAGVCFRVPFPFSNNLLLGNSIGSIYGNNDSRLPATFEAENMGLTASGLSGFNNNEAEDLGPFDALTFFIKHEWRYQINGSGNLVFFAANFPYRCALYDIDDTVVTHDFVIPFNNLWAPISLPVSGFETYKARAAWAFGNISQNIFLQELEILNSFRWRNIKKISIHWLGTYDDQGRFAPQITLPFTSTIFDPGSLQPAGASNIKVSVDSFQWSKPGLSLSPPNTDRPLQPQFFYEPFITNKFQNDQANLAKLEIIKFRHKEFEITTVGLNDLRYGDSFFLENSQLVNDEDRTLDDIDDWVTATNYILKDDVQDLSIAYRCILDNTSSAGNKPPNTTFWTVLTTPVPNTIKLVAKKIVRLIDKVPTGPGGFLRTVTGIRRFQEGEE